MQEHIWASFVAMMAVACGLAVVFPLSAAFSTGVMVLSVYSLLAISGQKIIWPDRTLWICLGSFCALFLAMSVFSIDPENSLCRGVKVSFLILFGIGLIALAKAVPADRFGVLKRFLPYLFLVSAGLVFIQQYFKFSLYDTLMPVEGESFNPSTLNKNVAIAIMLFPVVCAVLYRQRRFAVMGIAAIIIMLLVYKTESQAAQMAAGGMFLAFLLGSVKRFQRFIIIGTFSFLIILSLALPFVSSVLMNGFAGKYDGLNALKQASFSMRLENYDFLSKSILERPWTGYGMDSTREMTFDTKKLYYTSDTITHPHNAALQIWIEFGVFGVLAFGCFLAYLCASILRAPQEHRRLYYVLFCGSIVFLMVSWSIWASWLVGFLFMLCAVATMIRAPRAEAGSLAQTH